MPAGRGVREEEGAPTLQRGALFLLSGLLAGLGLLLQNPQARRWEVNLGGIALALVSAWACARRGAGGTRPGLHGWRWLALALLLQAAAHGVLLAQFAGYGRPWFGPLSDWLFLAVLPALFIALLLWPQAHQSPGRRRRATLDAFLFGGSLLFIFWQLGLRDLAGTAHPGTAPLLILPFVLVCLDFGYWTYLVLPAADLPRGPLGYLGLTLVGACGINLAAMLAGLAGTYAPGHWTDALTLPVLVLPALAAWSPLPAALPPRGEALEERPGGLQMFLPFLPAVAGLGVVVVQLLVARHRLDWRTAACAAAIVGGLCLRQFLSLWDLERLSRSLESRVRERTQELTHAQDVLVRTERMNAMATLGAGLAHDLKNLIGVVRNYALLVHRDLQEGRSAEMEDLEAIQLASSQAVGLANQLMNYGRGEKDEDEAFDLTLRLRQLTTMLRATLPAGITLTTQLPEGPLILRENPFHMDQMLVNLVLNARDALPQGGAIEVSCTEEQPEKGPRMVRLEVRDDGTGMTEDVKAHLFEPFFTTKPSGHGTGIGLASVKEALRGFRGRITVESEPGLGTRFIILLPLD